MRVLRTAIHIVKNRSHVNTTEELNPHTVLE